MGINKVILVGNVGRDPEVKATQSGTTLAKFTLATSEPRWKDQDGNPHTEWHNIVAWGRQAEICNQYVRKGSQLYIEGRIRRHEYEKNGQRMFFTEVHMDTFEFVGSRPEGAGGSSDGGYSGPSGGGPGPDFPDDGGEDIPF